MAGKGSSVMVQLPKRLDAVLESDGDAPCATRLVATIGPATHSVDVLEKLLKHSMRIARFDFTGGDLSSHVERYKNLQTACANTGIMCGVLINVRGPDIHVVNRPKGTPITLSAGQTVRLTNEIGATASDTCLPINWPGSFKGAGIAPGSTQVFVGQYLFTGSETTSGYMTVQRVDPDTVTCIINNTCTLPADVQLTIKFSTGVNTPLPCLGAQDEADLAAWAQATAGQGGEAGAAGAGIDYIALPRTRSAADVAHCRAVLDRLGLTTTKIWAKLEEMEGLVHHAEICSAADAIILSRGTLGTCLEPEKVFLAQKMILSEANNQGKPVFVTRVVDTMTDAPRPTRAEATDIANLVLDGADGVMLGSETFRGKYPVEVLRTVAAICRSAETVFDNYAFYRTVMDKHDGAPMVATLDRSEALASSAVRAAHKMQAALIVVFTVTGRTARLLAKYKPSQPILTVVCTDPSHTRFTTASSLFSNGSSPKSAAAAAAAAAAGEGAQGIKKVGSDVLLSPGQLRSWSHGTHARGCLMYRGTLPISMDAPSGQAGDVLEEVLEYAKAVGLCAPGDRVVVSQCPRQIDSEVMGEAGVVSLITVDKKLV